jgi:hypothetical protein
MDSRHYRNQASLLTRLAVRARNPEVAHRLRNRAQHYLVLAAVAEGTERQRQQQPQSKLADRDE